MPCGANIILCAVQHVLTNAFISFEFSLDYGLWYRKIISDGVFIFFVEAGLLVDAW